VFGLLLALGSMQREFTFLALPALVLALPAGVRRQLQAPDTEADGAGTAPPSGGLMRAGLPPGRVGSEAVRFAVPAAGEFALAWLVVDDLKMHLTGGGAAFQLASLGGQMCLAPHQLVQNGDLLVSEGCGHSSEGGRWP
jgi:hypothetical protein